MLFREPNIFLFYVLFLFAVFRSLGLASEYVVTICMIFSSLTPHGSDKHEGRIVALKLINDCDKFD